MLVALAQRQLHRRQPDLAKAIGDQLTAQSPGSVEARSVKGYAALKAGDFNEAAKIFDTMAQEKGDAEIAGKEGRAAVLARQGKGAEALKVATEVAQKAPKRGYAEMIRGDLLAQQGQSKEALVAYQAAAAKTEGAPFQRAEAFNRLGQFKAKAGEFEQARKMYDQAVAMDPYFLEPTSNKGVAYEKEGRWDKALEQYRKSLTLDGGDTIAVALARKAEEMIAVQKDMQRKERVDKLVKELVERYRQQKSSSSKDEDEWTSRPMVLSLVDFEEKGGVAAREGFSSALITHIGTLLNTSGRVKVVERVVLDRLLAELNIGSSELADQNTALKLGRVLAAKLIATGSVLHLPEATMLNLRLIDTETTAIAKTYSVTIESQNSLDRRMFDLNRDLLGTIIQSYPLRGFVVKMVDERALLNIGTDQGVIQGTRFEVLEPGEAMVYKGRQLKGNAKPIGQLEVLTVEPGLSYGRVLQKQRPFKTDDQIQEVSAHAVNR
jgi:tetratricopeptide (TPR) repeat protein